MTTRFRDERGSITTEAAIWLPPAFVAVLVLVQVALWLIAVDTSSAAAQQGLSAGRVLGGSSADAQREATAYLAHVSALIHNPQVSTAGSTDTRMQVSVSVDVLLVVPIPGWQWHIDSVVAGVREHIAGSGVF
jgi:hypothetical protein